MKDILDMNPSELAQHCLELSELYAKAGELSVKLQRSYALFYETHRSEVKSDSALERKFELTEDGLALMEIRMKMKTLQSKISAIKTLLRVAENENKNQW